MNINFDEQADALYIQFQKKESISKTIKVQDGFLVDIDTKGRIFGIEILDVSHRIPLKNIEEINIHVPLKLTSHT